MKRLLFILAVIVLFTSCGTIHYPYLVGTDDNDTQVLLQRGNYTLQLEEFDDDVTVTVEGLDIGSKDLGAVYIGIENDTDEIYAFADKNIEIFGGNRDTGEWTSLGLWDANAYYESVVKKEQKARALALISFVFDVLSSSDGNSGGKLVSAGLNTAAAISVGDAISSSYFKSSSWLKENMLYSSAIRKYNAYSGIVLFSGRNYRDKAYPDFKIVFNNNDKEVHEFVLQRSDRESVLNPWIDSPWERFSLNVAYDPVNGTISSYGIFNHPTSIDLYMGGGVSVSDKEIVGSLPIGITIKAFPNTWIMVGGDILFGTINDTAIQAGVNIVTNRLSAFVLAEYAFRAKRFGVSFGIGYAFIKRP